MIKTFFLNAWFLFGVVTLFSLLSTTVTAQSQSSVDFGEYSVQYSIFNSLFVEAEVAQVHGLVRAKDQALINVSVQKKATGKSVSATVSGTAKNLMQQLKTISFKTIDEPGAIYYIGSVRHTNREVFHFEFSVKVEGEPNPFTFKVTQKLYTER